MSDLDVTRRQFVCGMATGAAGISFLSYNRETTWPRESEDLEVEGEVLVRDEEMVDVLVIGGGAAGAVAAIQSARAGLRTCLVEQNSLLGGTITVGGVAFPGLFHAWGEQIIAGIGWELVCKTVELDGKEMPDFAPNPDRHWHNQVLVNPYLYALLAEEACLEAGVSICYYEFPGAVAETQDGWDVEIFGPGTRRQLRCSQIIDCTGGADVVGMMGLPRLREQETQPGSMLYQFNSAYHAGNERLSQVYVHGADSSNSVTRTEANLDGRRTILRRLREERETGDSEGRLTHIQAETAFRESYRIKGETLITRDDYVTGRFFEDAIAYAFYPVDLHTADGVTPQPLDEGVVPTIPLGALIPKDSRRLIVAGRSVSSDRLANSGLRVQASCMAMGQAAGAAAALAAERDTTPLEVPLDVIQDLLRRNGAIVPDRPTNGG